MLPLSSLSVTMLLFLSFPLYSLPSFFFAFLWPGKYILSAYVFNSLPIKYQLRSIRYWWGSVLEHLWCKEIFSHTILIWRVTLHQFQIDSICLLSRRSWARSLKSLCTVSKGFYHLPELGSDDISILSSSFKTLYFESLTIPLRERETKYKSRKWIVLIVFERWREELAQPHELRMVHIIIHALFCTSIHHVNKVTDLL